MRFKTLAFAAAVSVAVPAIAQTADTTAPAPKKEKKICRREGPATGSIMAAPPICRSQADWAKIDDANGRSAGDMLDRARAGQSKAN